MSKPSFFMLPNVAAILSDDLFDSFITVWGFSTEKERSVNVQGCEMKDSAVRWEKEQKSGGRMQP